jgi:hypothetical protein
MIDETKEKEILSKIEAELDIYFWNLSTPQTLTDDLVGCIHTEILDIIERGVTNG